MKKTFKVRLKINKTQEKLLYQFAGSARYAYNWCLATTRKYYNQTGLTLSEGDVRKMFTLHKKEIGNEWMSYINNDVFKQGIRDAYGALKKFWKSQSRYPKFKSKYNLQQGFYNDVGKITFTNDTVKLTKLPEMKLCEKRRIPVDVPYFNPRIITDGRCWYTTVSVETKVTNPKKKIKSIGIDLGLKDFAVIAKDDPNKDEYIIKNFKSKKQEFKSLELRKKKLQKKLSKYQNRKRGEKPFTKGKNYNKLKQELLKVTQKATNIQLDYIHKITTMIAKTKPSRVVIEDLNVKGMIKNHKLAKWVSFNQFYKFKVILAYKLESISSELVITNRFFPSTQACCMCGRVKEGNDKLTLSDRTYECDCGNSIDRDINAAINLCNYSL